MKQFLEPFNGPQWRILTPILQTILTAFVTILLFIISDLRNDLGTLSLSYQTLSNNLHHQMVEINERVVRVESKLGELTKIMNGISEVRPKKVPNDDRRLR